MSESITELARTEVRAISVPMRPDPTQLHKLDEMMLQANGDDTVQVDVFGTDPQGNPYHESLAMDEQDYEQLRKNLLAREIAILPPFSSFKSGNTLGRVVGETPTAAVPASHANPPIEAETDAESTTGDKILDGVQIGLDVVGLIPVFGEIADVANAGISLARGDYVGAGLSLVSAIPFVGWFGTAGKAARYGTTAVETSGKVAKDAAEKAAKEAVARKAKSRQTQGAKFKPKKLPKEKPHCFDPRNSKKYKKMSEAQKQKYLHEYHQQLKRQEDAINNMSAKDFADARRMFNHTKQKSPSRDGRNPKAAGAQEAFRKERAEVIERSVYESARKNGASVEVAEATASAKAKEIMNRLAALHEPDMVAGGWSRTTPSALGDKHVNSAIGGSWGQKKRVTQLEKAAEDAVNRGDGKGQMNVELTICPPTNKGKRL